MTAVGWPVPPRFIILVPCMDPCGSPGHGAQIDKDDEDSGIRGTPQGPNGRGVLPFTAYDYSFRVALPNCQRIGKL
jgi:hypothetical protein